MGTNTVYVGFTGGTGGLTADQEILTWTYNNFSTTTTGTPVVYATTSLAAVSSGPTFRQFSYSGDHRCQQGRRQSHVYRQRSQGRQLRHKTFLQKVSHARHSQLAINGSNLGATLDQYGPGEAYAINGYGTFNFATTGNYWFKFTATGKGSASSSYSNSFDDITLTPQ